MTTTAEKSSPATVAPAGPLVTIVKVGAAPKLSPRGEGSIAYQVGRIEDKVYLRITANESGGRHSKEWVPLDRVRAALTAPMRRGEPFKSSAMTAAFTGRSQNNSGFLVAVLRAEGVLASDPDYKSMSRLSGDIEAWETAQRAAKPLMANGKPETAPLEPPPPAPRFAARRKGAVADGEPGPKKPLLPLKKRDAPADPVASPPENASSP